MDEPPPSRRGLFSCLHSSKCDDAHGSGGKDVTELLHDLLVGTYAAAFDRLPFEGLQAADAEKLLTAMCTGGVCVGLLDPVSNIILNTISVLPRDYRPAQQSPPRRSKRLTAGAGAAPYTPRPRKPKRRPDDYVWSYIIRLSCHSLVRFLVRYFGCLTPQQAARYLLYADANLALAVMLVDHDLYAAAAPGILDPASERTQAALKCAATSGRHPEPDALVRLHTSPLPQQRLIPAAPFLRPGGRNLALDDVKVVNELLRYQDSASLDLQVSLLPDRSGVVVYRRDLSSDQGKLIHDTSSSVDDDNNGGRFDVFTIKVERHGSHFASLLDEDTIKATFKEKLDRASLAGSFLKSCGDACEYTESLKMRLHATIHAFYLKVFTMLPSNVSHRLIRYILFAGHCYGPMDPLSNIIITSIWHSIVFPLHPADSESQEEAYDILDTLAMLRVEVRSLEGLIALVKANSGCTKQQAMEHLCYKSCHLSEEMHSAHGFVTAAKAAQHPQHAALGSFLSSHLLDILRPLLSTTNGTLSSESLDQVERILNMQLRETAVLPTEAQLYTMVKQNLLTKRSEYNYLRLLIRSELATVLKKYAYEHPEEPKYVPSVICGVVETYYSDRDSYYVNFVAASESGDDNQLFFAELNFPCHQLKPNFCRRLCLTHTGRCFYGQTSAIKIMYPDSSDYFQHDITCDGIKQAGMTLDADFVFDCRRDAQFAEDVVKYYDDRKPMSEVDPV